MSIDSPKLPALVSVRYVICSLLNRMQDYSFKSYKRLVQICVEGISEEFSIYHTGMGNEVVYLHMTLAKTAPLPADFIDWLRLGVPIDGKLRVITQHESLLMPRTFDDGTPVGNADDGVGESTEGLVYFSDHYRNGSYVGGLFGLSGGIDDAYYRFDMENRQIVFSGSVPRSEIVLEYVSTGLKLDGSSLIPREVVAPLRNYILWQKDITDPRIAYNAKEMAKREFEESVQALRFLNLSFTADEYLDMLYSTYTQSPKR
jgi:hypothetical protein